MVQSLGELRYAFMLVPLLFVFAMYFVSNNIVFLGTNFLLSLMVASLVAVVTSYIPLTGNSEATFISFTAGFALAFWGLSVAGFTGALNGVATWADSIASFLEGHPPIAPTINGTTLNVNMLNYLDSALPNVGGWTGGQLWATLMIGLSFMYGLGLYFLITSRGH